MNSKTRILMLGVFAAWLSILGQAYAQTVVWSENFDDGNANDRWYADTGDWQIGSPTIGPETNSAGYHTHSGPACATTGLTANYPTGANSRLIRIQTFIVPAANESPRLRFWQWYSFAAYNYYDYGVVELKVGTNAWQEVSPRYTGSGGDWTSPSVDLSAFAGQTVQLAFHMVYQNQGGRTAPGWYVDDLALVTGRPVFNNLEGWENGIGDWYAETGTWQVGTPTGAGFTAHSGTNCAATGLSGAYPAGANSRLISPPFQVPAANQFPRLRFWQYYNFAAYNYYDYGVVEVKVGTKAWQEVSPRYTGSSGGGYSTPSVDLSAFAGQTVQLAFHMVYQNQGGRTAPGWYVDDLALVTGTPVFNNPEGWETGIGDWYAETGTWQVGKPTGTGFAAHSGTNCAATGLNGSYPAGANSRLISPPFIVPPASTAPNLRFWSWYSLAAYNYYDYGVVEIKAGTNDWKELTPHYTGNSGSWTEPFVDLTPYAGQTVQVDFHIVYQNNGGRTAPGWYVDDVQVLPPIPVSTATITINANPPNGGTTRGGATYPVGSQAQISATPVTCMSFVGWSDGNTQNPRTITVPIGGATYTANFNQTIAVIPNPTNGGTTSGGGTYPVGSQVQILATPASGWTFVGWSDGNTQNPRTITVPAACTYTASFDVVSSNPIAHIPDGVASAGVLWTYRPIITGSGYTFVLLNAPQGMTVDSTSGLISWTPTAAQAPALYSNIVLDARLPGNLWDSNPFSVRVQVALPSASVPIVTPNEGSYSNSVLITLACSTPGATIHYTTDGSDPSSNSTVYSLSFELTHSSTVKAMGSAAGYSDSPIATASFTITHCVLSDFNGDGISDIVLQDTNGFLNVWFMNTNGVAASTNSLNPVNTGDPRWRVVGCGDFFGDCSPDLLFQYTDGSLAVWTMEGTNMTSSAFLDPANHGNPDWKAVAVADFNNDGASDILLQNSNGDLAIWFMDDLKLSASALLNPKNPGQGWKAVGAGDFNGDGNMDIVFQYTDGSLAVWYLTGGSNLLLPVSLDPPTTGDPHWSVVGVTDLNGDGHPDLLFQHQVTGDVAVWYMDGPKMVGATLLTPSNPGGTWKIKAP